MPPCKINKLPEQSGACWSLARDEAGCGGKTSRERERDGESRDPRGARPTRVDEKDEAGEVDGRSWWRLPGYTIYVVKRGWRARVNRNRQRGSQLAAGALGGEGNSYGVSRGPGVCESQKSASAWANTRRAGLMWEREFTTGGRKGRETRGSEICGQKGKNGDRREETSNGREGR
jgi:hypothetical protein